MSSRMRIVVALALALLLGFALHACGQRAIPHAPGVIVAQAPLQTEAQDTAPVELGKFRLTPLADFEVEARVLSRANYAWDAGSRLSPMDLALGWERMSDSAVLDKLKISQSGRFYWYRWSGQPPIPAQEIVRSSANMHMIPADAHVARMLRRIRQGTVVKLRGQLVQAQRADGWVWTSSLTRTDTGRGACELVLVHGITLDNARFSD